MRTGIRAGGVRLPRAVPLAGSTVKIAGLVAVLRAADAALAAAAPFDRTPEAEPPLVGLARGARSAFAGDPHHVHVGAVQLRFDASLTVAAVRGYRTRRPTGAGGHPLDRGPPFPHSD